MARQEARITKRERKALQLIQRANEASSVLIQEQQSLRFHSGPLPSADELAGYEHARPGTADRVVTMAENEQRHRHAMDSGLLSATRFGQYASASVAMGIVVAAIMAPSTAPWGFGALGVAMAGVAVGWVRSNLGNGRSPKA